MFSIFPRPRNKVKNHALIPQVAFMLKDMPHLLPEAAAGNTARGCRHKFYIRFQ